jgi:crossover junction endonuclease MUS81
MAAEAALRRLNKDSLLRTQSSSALPSNTGPRSGPRLSSHIPVATPLMEINEDIASTTPIPDFRPDQAAIFPAGSYDVRLILDTREVESKSSRDDFSDKLRAKGLEVETRALRLGDVMWLARRRDGLGGEEDECVLDYVVERKRLDDLCHSIKDGRYTEQCVRPPSSSRIVMCSDESVPIIELVYQSRLLHCGRLGRDEPDAIRR